MSFITFSSLGKWSHGPKFEEFWLHLCLWEWFLFPRRSGAEELHSTECRSYEIWNQRISMTQKLKWFLWYPKNQTFTLFEAMDFDCSCAVRACVFNRTRTVLDWLCSVHKELIPIELCLFTDWILTGILHIPWTLYTLARQPAASCWLNLLTSTRLALLLLYRRSLDLLSVTWGIALPLATSSPSLQEQPTISAPWLSATEGFASVKVALWRHITTSVC